MKELVQRINGNTGYAKFIEWSRLIAITGSAQVIVQSIGFFSGILVIRLLSPHEYGLYTLVNMMIGTMTILADGGISTGVMGQGGKVWENPEKLGAVLASGLILRRKFAFGSLMVASPILFLMLRHHGASLLMSSLLLISLLPAFLTTLSGTLLEIGPKLRQDISPLQKIQVGVNMGRLALLTLTLFVFPWAFVAILAAGLPQILANMRLRKISSAYIDWDQKPDPVVQKEVLAIVKRILPTAIYYCVSGQITIWLISIFGSTVAVAQIGALGRLAMGLTLFNILLATLIIPRFARMPAIKSLLIKRYIYLLTGILGLSICIITATWIFHSEILWILGEPYKGLRSELVLNIIGSCLALIAAISYSLYTSRGWVIKPVISIPVNIAAIIIAIPLLDVSTLQGILFLNIVVAGVQVVMNMIFIFYKMAKVQENSLFTDSNLNV